MKGWEEKVVEAEDFKNRARTLSNGGEGLKAALSEIGIEAADINSMSNQAEF